MGSGRLPLGRQEVGKHRRRDEKWHRRTIRSAAELGGFIQLVTGAMTAEGFSDRDIFAMHLAVEEAIVNAIKHGHGGDETKQVRVGYALNAECVLAEVADQGPGFDPAQIPDPVAAENLERPSGRGLLLMRHYMTSVDFNKRGNRVTLCKCRTCIDERTDFASESGQVGHV